MKFFVQVLLGAFVFAMSGWALAQTPITKDVAAKYYKNCKAKPPGIMSGETQDMLCSCTAGKLMENLSIEDMRTMTEETQEGRNMLNKMLIEVYAPCMEFPVKDLILDQCLKDPQLRTMSKNLDGLCGCVASGTAEYIATNGPDVLRQVLAKTPNITDPLGPMMESDAFQKEVQGRTMKCLQTYH